MCRKALRRSLCGVALSSKIDYNGELTETVPTYLCMIGIPFFYSISEGIAFGIISYVVMNVLAGKAKKLNPIMYVLFVLFILKFIFL